MIKLLFLGICSILLFGFDLKPNVPQSKIDGKLILKNQHEKKTNVVTPKEILERKPIVPIAQHFRVGFGKCIAMKKIGNRIYISYERGLEVVDITDPLHPKSLYVSLLRSKNNPIMAIEDLGNNKILVWEGGDGAHLYSCNNCVYRLKSNVLRVYDFSLVDKPRITGSQIVYSIPYEPGDTKGACTRDIPKKCRKLDRELRRICKKIIIHNDWFDWFGNHGLLKVAGNDVYINLTYGIAHFWHEQTYISSEAGSVGADGILFKRFFDITTQYRNREDPMNSKKLCQEAAFYEIFTYVSPYLLVSSRFVINGFVVLDRDLNKVKYWDKTGKITNKQTAYFPGDAACILEDGEKLVIAEFYGKDKKIKIWEMNRLGKIRLKKIVNTNLKNLSRHSGYKMKCNRKNLVVFSVDQSNSDKALISYLELFRIEPKYNLTSQFFLYTKFKRYLDSTMDDKYLYLLTDEGLLIYQIDQY